MIPWKINIDYISTHYIHPPFVILFLISSIGRKFHKLPKISCLHRRHHKLENLRTLNLGDNQLIGMCLWLDEGSEEDAESHPATTHKSKLLFPNLSALDLSNNRIKEIPNAISELSNLSVFNVSGNSGYFIRYLFINH